MTLRLALFEDHISPGSRLAWPAALRALYIRRGAVTVVAPSGAQALEEDHCALLQDAVEISGEGELWCFEASRQAGEALVAEDERPRLIRAAAIAVDPAAPFVFRADRIDYPGGGVTPKHGHRGPGIRRLLYGRLLAEIGGQAERLEAPASWFETGHDPVVGRNLAPSSAFVRVMVLPGDLRGKPSFMPWSAEEAAKPRGVTPRLFFDEVVSLSP